MTMLSRISDMSRCFESCLGWQAALELAVEAEVGYLTVEAQALVGGTSGRAGATGG